MSGLMEINKENMEHTIFAWYIPQYLAYAKSSYLTF